MRWSADRWAIASESERALEVFAYLASDGKFNFDELVDAVTTGTSEPLNGEYLARLGRIVAVRPTNAALAEFALKALSIGVPEAPRLSATMPLRNLLFELLLRTGRLEEAERLLDSDAALDELYYGYMRADLTNPRLRGPSGNEEAWRDLYASPFREHGLVPVLADMGCAVPFNTLNQTKRPELFCDGDGGTVNDQQAGQQNRLIDDSPMVSVYVTTFNPDPDELRNSIVSVLRQTWTHLEVLLVDDASPEMPEGLLEELKALDDRVRLIRMPVNGGTYRGRNAAIREARGQYFTGQDTDDWSHPQRLERQLLALHGRNEVAGSIVTANRVDDDLVRTAIGFTPQRRCEVTVMVRTEVARAMGGYVPMRKGADSEFRERLIRHTGKPVVELSDPLYMTRLSAGSLSRADFRHGWTVQDRLSFSSAYRFWHDNADRLLPPIGTEEALDHAPFSAPARISGQTRSDSARLDICFVADWRGFGPMERSALDEIETVLERGFRVGVLQLDSPFSNVVSARLIQPRLQQWINDGSVIQLMPDEPAEVKLLIVRDPSVVDYSKRGPLGLRPRTVRVIAAGRLAEQDGLAADYCPTRVDQRLLDLFGIAGEWMVICEADRASLNELSGAHRGIERYPLVVRAPRTPRPARFQGSPIVLGRSATNKDEDWPANPEVVSRIYPPAHGYAVRVIGDARGGLRALKLRRNPPNWIDFRNAEISADAFWSTVDIAVQFERGPVTPERLRAPLEAMAAGVPVVCGLNYREILGDSVCAVELENAESAIAELAESQALRERWGDRGRTFVGEQYNCVSYIEAIEAILNKTSDMESL